MGHKGKWIHGNKRKDKVGFYNHHKSKICINVGGIIDKSMVR